MQRVRLVSLRRFALVGVLALVGGLALAGCQSRPGTAAYVGDTRFTDEQVDAMVASIDADVVKAQPDAKGQIQYGRLRQNLVQLIVFNELARRYAAEKDITVPPRDYKAAASSIGLPEADPYVKLSADANAYQSALLAKATPVSPTEADLRAVYDRIVKAGIQVGPYEQVKPQIQGLASLAPGLGLRKDLSDAADRYGVAVSPRYQPIELPLASVSTGNGGTVPIVTLPMPGGPNTPAVHDLAT